MPRASARRATCTNTVRSPASACAWSAASACRRAVVRPVDDGGDPRLDRTEQADQGGGVHVVGSVVSRADRCRRTVPEVPEQRRPGMPVGVDEPGHDDRVGRVHLLGVACAQPGTDLGDPVPVDQDVGLGEVGGSRAEGEHAPTSEQDPRRHGAPLTVQGHYTSSPDRASASPGRGCVVSLHTEAVMRPPRGVRIILPERVRPTENGGQGCPTSSRSPRPRPPGLHGVDWENRVDFGRLRDYRLARVQRAARAPRTSARILLFETSNIRYATSTHIGYWAFNKGERYALVTRTGPPRIWDFGSAAKAHRLQLPQWYDETNSVGGNTGLQGAISPVVGLQRRAAEEIRSVLKRGRRRRHAARRRPGRDVRLPRAPARRHRRPRRAAGHDARARDQEPGRDHAADPGVRDGRRRVPGHLRVPEARRPRERGGGARARAPVRDGLRVRRGGQLDRRRALQPASARVLRPADPAGRPGVLRHHPREQRLPDLLLPDLRRRPRDARRSGTRSRARASGWTPRSTS